MACRRVVQVQEYVAHSSSADCVAFGRKSGRLLATGGDDRKVCVWTIGSPTPICVREGFFQRGFSGKLTTDIPLFQTLTSLTSGAESVQFDGDEQHVVAGSSSGTLKLWDLQSGKSSVKYFMHFFIFFFSYDVGSFGRSAHPDWPQEQHPDCGVPHIWHRLPRLGLV
jgi:WD40 repeat protein